MINRLVTTISPLGAQTPDTMRRSPLDASRLRGETSDGIDDVHFHPAEPRQIRVSVDYKFGPRHP